MEAGNVHVESLGKRVVGEVPLADVCGKVSCLFQDLGEGENALGEGLGVGGWNEFSVL